MLMHVLATVHAMHQILVHVMKDILDMNAILQLVLETLPILLTFAPAMEHVFPKTCVNVPFSIMVQRASFIWYHWLQQL